MASECDIGMIKMFNTPSRSLDAPEGGERNLFCKTKLDVVVQMSWISSKLKLGGECKMMMRKVIILQWVTGCN